MPIRVYRLFDDDDDDDDNDDDDNDDAVYSNYKIRESWSTCHTHTKKKKRKERKV